MKKSLLILQVLAFMPCFAPSAQADSVSSDEKGYYQSPCTLSVNASGSPVCVNMSSNSNADYIPGSEDAPAASDNVSQDRNGYYLEEPAMEADHRTGEMVPVGDGYPTY